MELIANFNRFYSKELESMFGPESAVFSSYQAGLHACLELVGTTTKAIPVVVPTLASPQVMAAVLRAGGIPLLLDVDRDTLQISEEQLSQVVEAYDGGVCVLTRPLGWDVSKQLLDLLGDRWVTIVSHRLPPPRTFPSDHVGTFDVYDLEPIVGDGCVVRAANEKHANELLLVRSGLLGHSSHCMPGLTQSLTHALLDWWSTQLERDSVCSMYNEGLTSRGLCDLMPASGLDIPPYFPLRVADAPRTADSLVARGVEALCLFYPLHLLPEIEKRRKDDTPYHIAEEEYGKYLALPVHVSAMRNMDYILDSVEEAVQGQLEEDANGG